MKRYYHIFANLISAILFIFVFSAMAADHKTATQAESLNTKDMALESASVTYYQDLELIVFAIEVQGIAGNTYPMPNGELHGAPVLGYVFPTTLSSQDLGFGAIDGIVALAVTSHPDFDDTPLWDENNDFDTANDGRVFHSHWAVLGSDDRVAGGLSVLPLDLNDKSIVVPGTFPDMPIYLDSPGFSVVMKGSSLKVLVPSQRINYVSNFNYDAVSAYMEVNTSDNGPMLGVYQVYNVLSDDLSLPYRTIIE